MPIYRSFSPNIVETVDVKTVRLKISATDWVYIDVADYAKVKTVHWHVHYGYGKKYARATGVGYMHRVLTSAPPKTEVDHDDGDGLNNRKENLKVGTSSQNQMNRHRVNCNSKSGHTGVVWAPYINRWRSHITVNRKYIHIGTHKTIAEAIAARKDAEKTYFAAAR